MTKFWTYFQYILVAALFVVLGWLIISKVFSKKESISPLEAALRIAKGNRTELEKVLRHYQQDPADSLKYRAACFLIENMPFYSYEDGEQLEKYKVYYAWLKQIHGKTAEQIGDSVIKTFGPIGKLERKRDIQEVDSAYLCNNIDWAFKVWEEQPWGKNISFDIFCEYLLPYRIEDESLTYWREMYYEKYNSLLDSLRMSDVLDKEDPVVAANYLINKLADRSEYHTSYTPCTFGHIGPEYVQYMSGTCRERTDYGAYLLRALGIPCAIDFFILCGRVNAGHFWLSTWNKNGEILKTEFPGYFVSLSKEWWYLSEDAAKYYRHTFSLNRELLSEMNKLTTDIYPFWRVPMFVDVSYSYARYYKERLRIPLSKIDKRKAKGKIAYLCMSNRNNWTPVDWTEYDPDNLVFKDVRKGAVMRVATYENETLTFLTDPFYMDQKTNQLYFYSCVEEKEDVVLYAKYTLKDDALFRERMIGGVFEGSNQPDFAKRDTLFLIHQKPFRLNTSVATWSKKAYRYVRYVGPDGGHGNVAEIALYSENDTIPLKGKIIGTPGCYQKDGSHEYTNAFDGKSWTSFDYIEDSGGWTGLDMGTPKQINKIVYTPLNRDNYVRPGDTFELFYCDETWKSAGVQKASSDSLVYRNVPRNALLLLRNRTQGVQERIFTYEKGEQQWK